MRTTIEGDSFGAKFIYRHSPAGDEIVVHHVKEVYTHADAKSGKKATETNGILFVGEKGKIFVSRSVKVSEPANIVADGSTRAVDDQLADRWVFSGVFGLREHALAGQDIRDDDVPFCRGDVRPARDGRHALCVGRRGQASTFADQATCAKCKAESQQTSNTPKQLSSWVSFNLTCSARRHGVSPIRSIS